MNIRAKIISLTSTHWNRQIPIHSFGMKTTSERLLTKQIKCFGTGGVSHVQLIGKDISIPSTFGQYVGYSDQLTFDGDVCIYTKSDRLFNVIPRLNCSAVFLQSGDYNPREMSKDKIAATYDYSDSGCMCINELAPVKQRRCDDLRLPYSLDLIYFSGREITIANDVIREFPNLLLEDVVNKVIEAGGTFHGIIDYLGLKTARLMAGNHKELGKVFV